MADKKRLSQRDVPSYDLQQARRIADAIAQNYASEPTKPLHVAQALGMAPNSSHFRQLCGAAIAYGLTDGGYNAPEITLTELGRKITRPLSIGEDTQALREAFMKPRIIGDFLTKYNGSPFPPPDIGRNVLLSMGVPANKTEEVYQSIVDGSKIYGLTTEIKGKLYGDLESGAPATESEAQTESEQDEEQPTEEASPHRAHQSPLGPTEAESRDPVYVDNKRVFISHGKDKTFIEPVKKLLAFGELLPVVSTEKQTASIPVPEKVLSDMRSCSAAIIHVGQATKHMTQEGETVNVLNQNVLIEIGAALALYGKRFILLVKEGTELPSNLQGLFEVRYNGEQLSGDDTIRLLEAINAMKSVPPLGRSD